MSEETISIVGGLNNKMHGNVLFAHYNGRLPENREFISAVFDGNMFRCRLRDIIYHAIGIIRTENFANRFFLLFFLGL